MWTKNPPILRGALRALLALPLVAALLSDACAYMRELDAPLLQASPPNPASGSSSLLLPSGLTL